MRELYVPEKTGFQIKDPTKPVIIRDFRGKLFYSTEDNLPNVKNFNLPGFGKYFVQSGEFTRLENPISWMVPRLPDPEQVNGDPFEFKILFKKNPNKATIYFDEKLIVLDNGFKEVSLPKLYFIIYHEFAHQYYVDEALTDLLARNYMLKKGFNPEQIGESQINTLSNRQQDRKFVMVDSLNKIVPVYEQ